MKTLTLSTTFLVGDLVIYVTRVEGPLHVLVEKGPVDGARTEVGKLALTSTLAEVYDLLGPLLYARTSDALEAWQRGGIEDLLRSILFGYDS